MIDGNRVQHLLNNWNYKGFRMLCINIEDGYELIAVSNESTGVSTKAINIEGALYQLEDKIDTLY
ncbi:MAG TPA: hypothetical protein VJ991_01245 [Balneolales bacterium]|nr:hypothetical protein [Balneolales bacterium]